MAAFSQEKSHSDHSNFTVKKCSGRVVLCENGEPVPLVMYSPGTAFGNVAREDVDRFLDVGVKHFALWVGRHEGEKDVFTTPFWHSVDVLDEPVFTSEERFESVAERARYILARQPEARFLIRFYAHPPRSWKHANPSEMVRNEDGVEVDEVSLASEPFRVALEAFLLHMIGWFESQEWGGRVIGYVTMHDYEGTSLNAINGRLFDCSEPMRRAFRDHAGLEIPANLFAGERASGRGRTWRKPEESAAHRKYFEFVRQLFLARCRLFMTCGARALAGRKALLGMDALKQGMQGWIGDGFFSGERPRAHHSNVLTASGSFGADEFLDIEGFNILNTPYDYIHRHMGANPEPEGIADSVVLRGKIFLAEDDCRTRACSEEEGFGFLRDNAEIRAGLWRNVASAITRGYHSYWMDVTGFPSPGGGFFRDELVMQTIREILPIVERCLLEPHKDVPGIAVIIDDSSGLEDDFSSDFQNAAVIWQRLAGLGSCGVPFRTYLFEDLARDDFPEHRLFLFPNLYRVDDSRRKLLEQKVLRDGRVVLWGPATAMMGPNGPEAAAASDLTRIPMSLLDASYPRRVALTTFDHPATQRLSGSLVYGDSAAYGPILLPEWTESVSVEGVILTARGVNRPGLVIKEVGENEARWTSVFTAAVPVPANLIRELARHAGAHVYSESNDVILASQEFLGIHSVRQGPTTIHLPRSFVLEDLISGERSQTPVDSLQFETCGPQTRFYRLHK